LPIKSFIYFDESKHIYSLKIRFKKKRVNVQRDSEMKRLCPNQNLKQKILLPEIYFNFNAIKQENYKDEREQNRTTCHLQSGHVKF
jgi:hypothetical protein